MTYTTQTILDNVARGLTTAADTFVFLNFKSRNDLDSSAPFNANRIALKAENIDINTTRTVPSFPLPFSGAITGESTTLAIDLGMATKNISINGIITEQVITKIDDDDNVYTVKMTAHEVAQLLHASVDSSFIQTQQNIGELIILIPSRVNNSYELHAGTTTETPVDELPLVPFTFASRTVDQENSLRAANFPDPVTGSNAGKGVEGFIQTFGTNIVGGQPFIAFNLTFEVALVPLGSGR